MGYFDPFRSLLSIPILSLYVLQFVSFVDAISVLSTVLVFAPDSYSAYSVTSGLSGYGIPFELVLAPQTSASLPVLNSTVSEGNYGGIIVMSEAVPTTQWEQLYNYQNAFKVRMVRLNVYPSSDSGMFSI